MDRRKFLKTTALTTAALPAAARYGFASASTTLPVPVAELASGQVARFGASLRGRTILPGEAGYESSIGNFLGLVGKRPGLVVLPQGPEDIAATVRFAREHGLALAIRGGGHTAHSATDGGVLLNLTSLQKLDIDPVAKVLRAEPGLTGGMVDRSTMQHGLATVLGGCPSVGIAGLTLGGGLGRLMGQHGALCDNLVSANIVSADGRLLRAAADENADLFWALRGAGANFGIITSLEYRLHPIAPVISGVLLYPISELRQVVRAFGEFMQTAPATLDASIEIGKGILQFSETQEPAITVHVCCCGPLREAERAVEPMRRFGTPISDTIATVQYVEAQQMAKTTPERMPRPARRVPYTRRGFVRPLNDDVVDRIVAICEAPPSPFWSFALDHYMHGKVVAVPETDTSFSLRQAGFSYRALAWDETPQKIVPWANAAKASLVPYSGGRAYLNYLTEDEGEPGVRAAFGGNYTRLAVLKAQWDPTNFFNMNHNIKPAT